MSLFGVEDASCYSTACNPADGTCVTTFLEGQSCTLAALSEPGNVDAVCQHARCRDISGAKHCLLEADPSTESIRCPLITDDVCNAGLCENGVCKNVPLIDSPCSDGQGCTYFNGILNPITGELTDACRPDPTDPERAVCTSDSTTCGTAVQPCNSVKCVETPVGTYCLNDPLAYGTPCNDGDWCTIDDICQRTLVTDSTTMQISWIDSGVCSGQPQNFTTTNEILQRACTPGICTYCFVQGEYVFIAESIR